MSDKNSTCSSGRSGGTTSGPTTANGTRAYCACPPAYPPYMCEYPNRPDPEYPYTFSAICAFGLELSQSDHSERRQKKHDPQAMANGTTTLFPFFRLRTALPISTT